MFLRHLLSHIGTKMLVWDKEDVVVRQFFYNFYCIGGCDTDVGMTF